MEMQFVLTFVNLVDHSKCPEVHYLIISKHFTSTKPIQECKKPEKRNPLYALENLQNENRYIHFLIILYPSTNYTKSNVALLFFFCLYPYL